MILYDIAVLIAVLSLSATPSFGFSVQVPSISL